MLGNRVVAALLSTLDLGGMKSFCNRIDAVIGTKQRFVHQCSCIGPFFCCSGDCSSGQRRQSKHTEGHVVSGLMVLRMVLSRPTICHSMLG